MYCIYLPKQVGLWKHNTQNSKLKIVHSNTELETENPEHKPQHRNAKHKTQNTKLKTQNLEHKT